MKNTLILSLFLTVFPLVSQAADFDIHSYAKTLDSIETELNTKNLEIVSKAASRFNEASALYKDNLIEKFSAKKTFIGSDLYEMNHTLIVNHEINQALIELNAKDLLDTQVKNFREEFHSNGHVRRMMKSALRSILKKDTSNEWAHDAKNFNKATLADTIFGAIYNTTGFLSFAGGNLATPARLRNGYLNNNEEAINVLKAQLRPLDVIMSSTPFTVSSKFIPGRFSHGGIYLGTKEQLIENGMWDDPSILPYQKDIEAGKVILEALINGVQINTLEHFLNVDEVLVIRKEENTDLSSMYKRGLEQVGKKYNYNFDVLQFDSVLCTELIYLVYNDVEFKTNKTLGHTTIFPTDVAREVLEENAVFKTVINLGGTKSDGLKYFNDDDLKDHLK